jgi:hypothetical protein
VEERDVFDWGDNSDKPSGRIITPNPKPIRKNSPNDRKRKSSKAYFNSQTVKIWEEKGYWVESLQTWASVNGAMVSKDFCGCFDYEATKVGYPRVFIQVCAKSRVRDHLRKMLGDDEYKSGKTRRAAVNHFLAMGCEIYIQWFEQPAGHGSKWEKGTERLTPELIADIDSGRRTRRVV